MENNNYDDLHSFTLCRDDWEIIIDSLLEAVSDRLTAAEKIGLGVTYGAILYDNAQKIRAVADYLELHLPERND